MISFLREIATFQVTVLHGRGNEQRGYEHRSIAVWITAPFKTARYICERGLNVNLENSAPLAMHVRSQNKLIIYV